MKKKMSPAWKHATRLAVKLMDYGVTARVQEFHGYVYLDVKADLTTQMADGWSMYLRYDGNAWSLMSAKGVDADGLDTRRLVFF